jgi:ATP-binding cassette subfamily C (CFTR/MRP) protein 1
MLISPVITFVIFIATAKSHHTTLNPSKLFTSLSLLILLSEPLFGLFAGLIDFMSAIGCFGRIEKFLLKPSRPERRSIASCYKRASCAQGEVSTILTDETKLRNAIVRIQNGSFGWKETGEPALRNVNITVAESQLVAIVGPVGCGKSTVLKAILGETPYYEGQVHVSNANIAWCEQEAWLTVSFPYYPWLSEADRGFSFAQNGTVQRNIIGFSDFDATLYAEVVWCCDLHLDLTTLPKGDQTKIGSKGLSLSGGQRQRIVSNWYSGF